MRGLRRVALATALLLPVLAMREVRAASVATTTVAYADGTWIVQLKDGVDADVFLSAHGIDARSAYVYRSIFHGFSAPMTASKIREVAASSNVASVEADQVIQAETDQTSGPVSTNIPNSGVLQWGLDLIDQRGGSANGHYVYSADGTGVKVYVMDTGVNAAHADFSTRVTDGWSYRSSPSLVTSMVNMLNTPSAPYGGSCKNVPGYSANAHPNDVDTFDQNPDSNDKGKVDNEGHGTHVAGIIGGSVTGVAKAVTIVPVRILNSCGMGSTTAANAGIDWILTDHTNAQKAVVNMSIGFSGRPCTFERLITGAYNVSSSTSACRTQPSSWLFAEGIVVVAAAGNDPATDPCTTAPSGTPGTISVGAVDSGLAESWYSAYGQCVDIFAPGGSGYANSGINSTWHYLSTDSSNNSTYANESGTSMAAPHVAGAVAQYLQGISLPGDVTTVPTLAWTWLKKQATCDVVTYYSNTRTQQSPNRFLNIGTSATAPCAPRNITVSQLSGSSVVAWDEVATGNGNDISGYLVTTSPSTVGCTASTVDANGRATCTLTGLTDNTTYTVSVKATCLVSCAGAVSGTASLTAGPAPTTTTVAPSTTTTVAPTTTLAPSTTVELTPVAPSSASAATDANTLTVNWPATAPAGQVTYIVTITPGGLKCTTQSTTCKFVGVTLGVNYTFSIAVKSASGALSSSSLTVSSTAGFTLGNTFLKVRSRTKLSSLVKTVSRGARTYKVTSGRCKVVSGVLVAPTSAGTCRVKVNVARYGKYRAMSTTAIFTIRA